MTDHMRDNSSRLGFTEEGGKEEPVLDQPESNVSGFAKVTRIQELPARPTEISETLALQLMEEITAAAESRVEEEDNRTASDNGQEAVTVDGSLERMTPGMNQSIMEVGAANKVEISNNNKGWDSSLSVYR